MGTDSSAQAGTEKWVDMPIESRPVWPGAVAGAKLRGLFLTKAFLGVERTGFYLAECTAPARAIDLLTGKEVEMKVGDEVIVRDHYTLAGIAQLMEGAAKSGHLVELELEALGGETVDGVVYARFKIRVNTAGKKK
jgi:hypothetical protein